MKYCLGDTITGVFDKEDAIYTLEEARALRDKLNAEDKAKGATGDFWIIFSEEGEAVE